MKHIMESISEENIVKIAQDGCLHYDAFQDSAIKIAIADAIEKTDYYQRITDPLYEPTKEEQLMANQIKSQIDKLRDGNEEKDIQIKNQNLDENVL
jgi:hypothetical protein